jgi:hypothetical protein
MRRRRLFTLAGLAIAATAAWVAAPALSLSPYVPDPAQFSQKLPAAHRVHDLAPSSTLRAAAAQASFAPDPADGPVRWISPPVKAPATFDAVGLTDDPNPVELRTRRAGEPWTDWHEVDSGDPVWAGHSTELQVRSRGAKPSGRLDYIDVGDGPRPGGALATMRGAIHAAFVAVAAEPMARAQTVEISTGGVPPKPAMVPRLCSSSSSTCWDPNNKCPPRRKASYGKVKAAVIHHTVNTNTYSQSEAPKIVLADCLFHRNSNGWDHIGYNALVDRFGITYEGRDGGVDQPVIGAHAQGFNAQTAGIASIGDHRTVPISDPAVNAIESFLAWKLYTVGGHHANEKVKLRSGGGSLNRWKKGKRVKVSRVTFHSKLGNTECPGAAGRSQVKHQIIPGTEQKIADASQSSSSPPPSGGGTGGGVGTPP